MTSLTILNSWGDAITNSFMGLWDGVIHFLPNVVLAIIIFLAGWVVGRLLGDIVTRVVRSLKLDSVLEQAGIGQLIHRAGGRLDVGKFLGFLVEMFVMVAFLMAAFDVLGLRVVNDFLKEIVGYLPNVIVAVLILLAGGVVADVASKLVEGGSKAANVSSANFLSRVTHWAVWVFTILVALNQVGIASDIIQILLQGVVVAVSVAVGLAFGLGGQDAASDVIDRIRRGISREN